MLVCDIFITFTINGYRMYMHVHVMYMYGRMEGGKAYMLASTCTHTRYVNRCVSMRSKLGN